MSVEITYDDFRKVDMRVGKVIEIEDFLEAKKPSYKMKIDFGPGIGVKNSSAQITVHKKEELLNRLVIAVVNFPPKKIANFTSEVLTLGLSNGKGSWVIIRPEKEVELGTRVE
ncbi:MAG: tRNA-binding protein [Candidatus Aenigmatarchaeota archaeon]